MSGLEVSSGPRPPTANDPNFLVCGRCRIPGGTHYYDCPDRQQRHSLWCRCDECKANAPTFEAPASKPRIKLIGSRTWLCLAPDTSLGGFGMSPAAAYYDWKRRAR